MLVMIDGRSIVQPFYGSVFWDTTTLTKADINQIEVLRSPASAIWGANALNGVINIRSKSPRQVEGLRGDVGFGERGTKSVGLTWAAAPTDGVSYKLSGSYFEQDPWERDNLLPDGSPMPPGAVYENRGTKQPKFEARIDWDGDRDRGSHRVWSLRGGVAGAHGLTQSALGPGEFNPGSYTSYVELDHSSDGLDLKMYWNRLDSPYRIVLYNLPEHATSDSFTVDVTHRLTAMGRHNMTIGGSLSGERFDISIAPDDRGRADRAAFIEDSIVLSPMVTVAAGGRIDKFDTTSAVFAPRVGAVFKPAPAHAVHASYNRAYRAPSLLENFVNVELPAVVPTDPPFYYSQLTLGSTELDMEKQDGFEAGYTGVFAARATLSATAYAQRIANNIWFLPVSFYGPGTPPPGWPYGDANVPLLPHVFTFVNLGEVVDRGIELSGQFEYAPLSVHGSYTFQATPRLESDTNPPLQINRPPRHQGGAGLTYRRNGWTAAGDLRYTGEAFWSDVLTPPFWGTTDGFWNLNGRAAYRLTNRNWELWLSGTNLLDEKIKSHVFGDIVRRRVTAGLRWTWKP